MPSTATITSFYSFTANTKARAGEVNNNFSVYRGHIIPVNTDTASASNLSHDLGSTDHRWNNAYASTLYLGNTTTSWRIKDDTTTVGDLMFQLNGADAVRFNKGQGFWTVSGESGAYTNNTTTFALITNFSLTITTYGSPVEIFLAGTNKGWTSTAGDSPAIYAASVNQNIASGQFEIRRDSTTIGVWQFQTQADDSASPSLTVIHLPPSSFSHIDNSAGAGTYVYSIYGRSLVAGQTFLVRHVKMYAKLW